ncbi:MAG: DNA damage-inducible protein D [Phycisphaerae bacterium]|jgi:DNA-damage-inducible protein D
MDKAEENIMDDNLPVKGQKSFEELKKINQYGAEYWSARELQPMLGYTQWRRFEDAIKRAFVSCQQSGNAPTHHFAGAGKMITLGKGGEREVPDYHLSRFACYLIAQNGDPRKPEIANAQKYFAVQTRRQEISDCLAADMERLEIRKQASEEFCALSGAARNAGVQNKMFGVFHDAGYKGLYDGKGAGDIKKLKGIDRRENLMDRMNTTELAANQFRMTQTREKLQKENIKGQEQAIRTHKKVGQEVRDAIKRIGGTLPENIPPAEHIRDVKKRIKSVKHPLQLAGQDAKGLVAGQSEKNDAGKEKDNRDISI